MNSRPRVSVITIFFNAEKFIAEAIESVFAQTYEGWELLLVDDGSTDASTEIARKYAKQYPEKVRYLEHDGHKNRGMSATRNLGIRHSRGEYIAFLDADDVWLPQKLEHQVAILESQPRAGMVYGATEYWYSWTGLPEDLERDHVLVLGVPHDTLFEPPMLLTLLYPLGQGTAPCLCSLLVRSEVVEKVGGFEESFVGFYEDQAFLTKVYLHETVFVSGGCWDRYRFHPASCSAMVKQTEQYDSFRGDFLNWFKEYLHRQKVTEPKVWKALNDALRPYQDLPPGIEPEYKWLRLLRVAEGNEAHLVFPPDNPDMVRIAITKAETKTSYDIQLNQPRLKVKRGHRYLVNFLARADSLRNICFGFAKGHAPWTNLGLYSQIEVTPEWQSFETLFIATEDEDNARIHFDVGNSDVSVELSSVSLRSLSEGRFVKPNLPSPQGGQPVADRGRTEPLTPFGEVQFGSLRRVTPISQDFGCDRGRPIDRYYIEQFLARHGEDIRGRVLEIGDNSYTHRFGGDRVTISDVLHVVEGDPQATIIADLASADHIPSDTFDCIILTQTLQLIYDVRAAAKTLYRILKPAGVLLATFPGISQTYDNEWGDSWYWNLTSVSAQRLFEEAFPAANVRIETFGNVLAAISFLHGLAVEELTQEELDYHDPGYDLTITVRAVKPGLGNEVDGKNRPQKASRQVGSPLEAKALILLYHHVGEGYSDPWSLCVSPQHFSEQLEILQKKTLSVRLQELVTALDRGNIPRGSVVVTFDDGYADNLHKAKPLLERYDVPATVFLTTWYINARSEFWWDELERLVLQPGTLPGVLRLNIDGAAHQWELGDAVYYSEEDWRRDRSWRTSEDPPSARHSLYLSIWRILQPLTESKRRNMLDELRAWACAETGVRPTHRTLSQEEVIAQGEGNWSKSAPTL